LRVVLPIVLKVDPRCPFHALHVSRCSQGGCSADPNRRE
jgi:hypothetical protein